jgi:hypothetical protein
MSPDAIVEKNGEKYLADLTEVEEEEKHEG